MGDQAVGLGPELEIAPELCIFCVEGLGLRLAALWGVGGDVAIAVEDFGELGVGVDEVGCVEMTADLNAEVGGYSTPLDFFGELGLGFFKESGGDGLAPLKFCLSLSVFQAISRGFGLFADLDVVAELVAEAHDRSFLGWDVEGEM